MGDILNSLKNFSFNEDEHIEEPIINDSHIEENTQLLSYEEYLQQKSNIEKSSLPQSLKESYLAELEKEYQSLLLETKKQVVVDKKKAQPKQETNSDIREIFREELESLLENYYLVDKKSSEVYLKVGGHLFKGNLNLVKQK